MTHPGIKLSASLLVALGIGIAISSCADGRGPTSPARIDAADGVSALAVYQRDRLDPNSLGSRHNAGLATILTQLKAERVERGRKVLPSEACEILADFASSNGLSNHEKRPPFQPLRATGLARTRTGQPPCDLNRGAIALAPPRPAADPGSDLVDSVFALAEWDSTAFEGLPSTHEDSLFAVELATEVASALGSSSSYAEVQSNLTALVTSYGTVSLDSAKMISDLVGVAAASAEYWGESIEEWLEAICYGEEPPLASSLVAYGDHEEGDCEDEEVQDLRATRTADDQVAGDDPTNWVNYQYCILLREQTYNATYNFLAAEVAYQTCMLQDFIFDAVVNDVEDVYDFGASVIAVVGFWPDTWQYVGKHLGSAVNGQAGTAFRTVVRDAVTVLNPQAIMNAAGRVAKGSITSAVAGGLAVNSAAAVLFPPI